MRDFPSAVLRASRDAVRHPGRAWPVVAVLALGIAVSTSMFSVVNGVLFRPIAVADIARVVRVRTTAGTGEADSLSPGVFEALRERNDVLADMAAATGGQVTLGEPGEGESVATARVTAGFFDVLGLRPELGRLFAAGEDEAAGPRLVVLGHALWQRRFQGDPGVLGRTVRVDGEPHTIVGVLPRGVTHPYEAEAWTLLRLADLRGQPSGNFLYVPARLRPGVPLLAAQARLSAATHALHAERPDLGPADGAQLTPLRDELLGDLRRALSVLSGCALLVLVVALLNTATLLVARTVSGRRDVAVRLSLGARITHVFRDSLAAHLLLAGCGALLGTLAAAAFQGALSRLIGVAAIDEFDSAPRVDLATLGWACATALGLAVSLALLEAARARRTSAGDLLLSAGRGAVSDRRPLRLMGAFTIGQGALAFALTVAAVVVGSGYNALRTMHPGYDRDTVSAFSLTFPSARYPDPAARQALLDRLLLRLRALPGVEAAGASTVTPDFEGTWGAGYVVDGEPPPDPPGYLNTQHRLVTPGYFETMGMRMMRGSGFLASAARNRDSVVVSASFAFRHWKGADPIGRHLRRVGRAAAPLTVVGVVADVTEAAQIEAPLAKVAWYLPTERGTSYDFESVTVVVRSPHPGGTSEAVRQAVRAEDPELAVPVVSTLRERLFATQGRERAAATLFAGFAAAGVGLSGLGVFGVASLVAHLRRREYGLRMALGATPARLARVALAQSLGRVGLAVALGLPLSIGLIPLLRSALSRAVLPGGGPAPLWAAALVVLSASLLATLAPVRRIARVDPAESLRAE